MIYICWLLGFLNIMFAPHGDGSQIEAHSAARPYRAVYYASCCLHSEVDAGNFLIEPRPSEGDRLPQLLREMTEDRLREFEQTVPPETTDRFMPIDCTIGGACSGPACVPYVIYFLIVEGTKSDCTIMHGYQSSEDYERDEQITQEISRKCLAALGKVGAPQQAIDRLIRNLPKY